MFGDSNSSVFGSISGVSVGDVVAGGLVGLGGQTASAIEADPLSVLVDFPASSGSTPSATSGTSTAQVRSAAMKKALKLLGKDVSKTKKHSKKHTKRHNKKHAK